MVANMEQIAAGGGQIDGFEQPVLPEQFTGGLIAAFAEHPGVLEAILAGMPESGVRVVIRRALGEGLESPDFMQCLRKHTLEQLKSSSNPADLV